MKNVKIKKKFSAFLMALVVAGVNGVYATELNDAKIDIETNVVEISGNVGERDKDIVVMVLNPGGTLENIKDNAGYLQHQWGIKSGENGEFNYSFKLNLDGNNDSGTYRVYIGGKAVGEPLYKEFYYASEEDVKELINKIETADSVNTILSIISDADNEKKLSIDAFVLFEAEDKTEIARVLFENVKNSEKNHTASQMQKLIFEASVVAAFNNGDDELVMADDEFLYDDILKISTLDEDLDITLLDVYNSSISEEGKKLIREAMFNNQYNTSDELRKDFAKNILLKGMTNPKKNGFEHAKKILTDKNVKFAGLIINKTLTNDNMITLASESEYASIEALQKKIDSLKKTTASSSANKGSNGGNVGSVTINIVDYKPEQEDKEIVLTPVGGEKKFTDLENYSWAEDAIYELKEKGIVAGVSEDEFLPEGELTREQAVKILCISAGIEAVNEPSGFFDIDDSQWYAGYIAAAKDKGLINGISETEFGVGEKITRQDFAVMIQRVFKLEGNNEEIRFKDFEDVSEYAKDAVATLSEKSIISGYEDGSFKPFNNCQRAEAAVIIYRVLGGSR